MYIIYDYMCIYIYYTYIYILYIYIQYIIHIYDYVYMKLYMIIYAYIIIYMLIYSNIHTVIPCNSYTPQQFLSQLRNSSHPSGAMPSARKEKDCDDLSAAKGSNAFG